MPDKVYYRLADHMDSLPGGFPKTAEGVEIRILKLLFTPEEAGLALHLNLVAENAMTIAFRSGKSIEYTSTMLEQMALKGLVFRSVKNGKPPQYMAAQYIVGIWELQVDRLTPELVREMELYIPHLIDAGIWKKAPQMRVIPVNKSIDNELRIMTYEDAEALVRTKSTFVIAPCICRREMALHGKPCSKPHETCISFGGPDDYYVRTGAGRPASMEEVLELLVQADKAGLVLQPSNDREISWICCCCGCCCALLRNLKKFPNPGEIAASPFYAVIDEKLCTGCGLCIRRCQVDAVNRTESGLSQGSGSGSGPKIVLNRKRCIGCGLCVTTCPLEAIKLVRKQPAMQPMVPPNIAASMLRIAWKRGKIGFYDAVRMVAASLRDRFLAQVKFRLNNR